jgi:glycosyltransferase involved in cell wall biosynthesis
VEGWTLARQRGEVPEGGRLIIVGYGPEKEKLEELALRSCFGGDICFTGQINDVDKLRTLYSTAIASASTGCAGLSVTQSFAFGTPMIIARGEPHGPEVEACQEDINTLYFESDSVTAVADSIARIFKDRAKWLAGRRELSEWTGEKYSFETMETVFIRSIDKYLDRNAGDATMCTNS